MIELIIVVLALLNIADLLITNRLLREKGIKEGNPIMRFFIKRGLLIPAKVLLTMGVCYIIWYFKSYVIGIGLIAFYVFVVANNVIIWKKVKDK